MKSGNAHSLRQLKSENRSDLVFGTALCSCICSAAEPCASFHVDLLQLKEAKLRVEEC